MLIYTIAHSTLSKEDFLEILKKYNIELLVDIRSFPGSKYVPQLNKENMEIYLPENGIEYIHLKELGGRRNARTDIDLSLVEGWKSKAFRNYAAYSLTKEYENGIEKLLSLCTDKISCYMCSEALPWKCHRIIVSNSLVFKGIDIHHIIGKNKIIIHKLGAYGANPKIQNNKIFYPID